MVTWSSKLFNYIFLLFFADDKTTEQTAFISLKLCCDRVQWQVYMSGFGNVEFSLLSSALKMFCTNKSVPARNPSVQIYYCRNVYMLHALHVIIHNFGFSAITVYSAFCHLLWGHCNCAKTKQVQAVYESALYIQLLFPTIPLFILIFNELILY